MFTCLQRWRLVVVSRNVAADCRQVENSNLPPKVSLKTFKSFQTLLFLFLVYFYSFFLRYYCRVIYFIFPFMNLLFILFTFTGAQTKRISLFSSASKKMAKNWIFITFIILKIIKATIDLKTEDFEFLSDRLSLADCRRLVAALHGETFEMPEIAFITSAGKYVHDLDEVGRYL